MVDDVLAATVDLVRKFQANFPGKRVRLNPDGTTALVDATPEEVRQGEEALARAEEMLRRRAQEKAPAVAAPGPELPGNVPGAES